MQNNYPRGQIGLLLLVIMGVVVALVMSVASRSLSDTVLSRQERESSAAFAVAETGVENAMYALQNPEAQQQIAGSLTDVAGFVTGNYQVDNLSSYGLYLREGETAYLDLSTYVDHIKIYWTSKSDVTENITTCLGGSGNAPAAIEVSAFTPTGVIRSYYNPYGCVPETNGFSNAAVDINGSKYRSHLTWLAVPAGTTTLRVKPIYAGATISVASATATALADQLYLIQSKASGGDAQKEIEVKRGLDAPSSIFDFAVFTNGTIQKGL